MNPQVPDQNSLISFPLYKFSWASDPPTAKSFSWKQTMQNVVVVFDSFRSGEIQSFGRPAQILKVVQGTKTLEFVDIGEKVRMSKIVVDSARRVGVRLRIEEVPCSALHRRTACTIAIRYNLPNDYVRRIQLNLTSHQDFDAVLTILKKSGLISINSPPPPAVRGSQAADITSKASASGHSAVPVGQDIATNSRSTGLSPSTSNYVATSEDFLPITPPHPRMQSDNPSSETLHPEHPPTERPPSWHRDRPVTSPPPVQQHRPSTALPIIDDHEIAPGHPQRPSTAQFPQTQNDLSTMIPPRRELPFKRRSAAFTGNNQDNSSRKASTSTIDPPRLPKPHFAGKDTNSSTKPKRTRTIHAMPVSRRDDLGKSNEPVVTSKLEACRKVAGSTVEALENWSPNVQIGKPDQVRTNTNHGTQTQRTQFSAPLPVSARPTSAAPTPPSDESLSAPLKDILERLGPYLDQTSNERRSLTSYAALPNEERMKVLEDQVISLLGNESFVQLCEDLSACWQRIGLEI